MTAMPEAELDREEERGYVVAIMGGAVRKGSWDPPESLRVLALMGGVELDFRDARLLEGTSEVTILAVMGGVKIVVPPDVDLVVDGLGLMGGFPHLRQQAEGEQDARLVIRGVALMGGVEVKVS